MEVFMTRWCGKATDEEARQRVTVERSGKALEHDAVREEIRRTLPRCRPHGAGSGEQSRRQGAAVQQAMRH